MRNLSFSNPQDIKRSREEEEDSLPSIPDILPEPIEETVDPIAVDPIVVTVKLNTDFSVEPCVSAPAVIKTVNKRSSPSVVAPTRMTRSAAKASNQPIPPPNVSTPRRTRQKKVQLPPIEKAISMDPPLSPPVEEPIKELAIKLPKPIETIKELTVKLPKPEPEETIKELTIKLPKPEPEQTIKELPIKLPKPKPLKEEIEQVEQTVEQVDPLKSTPEEESMDLMVLDADSLDKEMEKRMEGIHTEQEKTKLREQYKHIKEQQEIRDINRDFPALQERYALVERAGRGTFSKVYKAKDLMVDAFLPIDEKYASSNGESHVAIKVIFEISSPQRVRDEINYLAMFR